MSDYYDKIGFDSRVDHLYDSGLCLIGSPAGLGNGLSILGHFAGLVLVSRSFLENYFAGHLASGGWASRLSLPLSFRRGRAFLHQQVGMPTYQMNPYFSLVKSPFDYAQTTTYQQAQGQLAIASGGLFGQGFNVSNLLVPITRKRYDFLRS